MLHFWLNIITGLFAHPLLLSLFFILFSTTISQVIPTVCLQAEDQWLWSELRTLESAGKYREVKKNCKVIFMVPHPYYNHI